MQGRDLRTNLKFACRNEPCIHMQTGVACLGFRCSADVVVWRQSWDIMMKSNASRATDHLICMRKPSRSRFYLRPLQESIQIADLPQ